MGKGGVVDARRRLPALAPTRTGGVNAAYERAWRALSLRYQEWSPVPRLEGDLDRFVLVRRVIEGPDTMLVAEAFPSWHEAARDSLLAISGRFGCSAIWDLSSGEAYDTALDMSVTYPAEYDGAPAPDPLAAYEGASTLVGLHHPLSMAGDALAAGREAFMSSATSPLALLVWDEKARGALPPVAFISAARPAGRADLRKRLHQAWALAFCSVFGLFDVVARRHVPLRARLTGTVDGRRTQVGFRL